MERAPDRDQLAGSNGNQDPVTEERLERLTGRLLAARELQRELGKRAQQGEERARVWRRKSAELEGRVENLRDQIDNLKSQVAIRDEELQAARRRVAHLQDQSNSAQEKLARISKEAAAERERHERTLDLVDSELAASSKELERAAASRSWRFGHGTMRFLRALTFRRAKGDRDVLQKAADGVELARRKARSRES